MIFQFASRIDTGDTEKVRFGLMKPFGLDLAL